MVIRQLQMYQEQKKNNMDYKILKSFIKNSIKHQFAVEGEPKWKKRKDKLKHKILDKTSTLKNSVVVNQSNDIINVESQDYGDFHIHGTRFMPVRDFTKLDETKLNTILEDEIIKELNL